MTNFFKDVCVMVVVAGIFVAIFISTASYHNRPGGFCEQVKTNHAERVEYIDYQIFCK